MTKIQTLKIQGYPKKSKKMDRRLLSKQDHEIAYLAKKLRTTARVIRDAHLVVGRSRKLVEAYVLGRQGVKS